MEVFSYFLILYTYANMPFFQVQNAIEYETLQECIVEAKYIMSIKDNPIHAACVPILSEKKSV